MESLNDIIGRALPERPRRSVYPTGEAGPHGATRREVPSGNGVQEQRAYRSQAQPVPAPVAAAPLSLSHHRRLQEQMARLGQKSTPAESPQRREQPPMHSTYPTHGASNAHMRPAHAEDQRGRAYAPPSTPTASTSTPTRQLYPRQTQQYQSAEQVRRQDGYEQMPVRVSAASSQVTPEAYYQTSRFYHTDEYAPPPQADVLNELDADDEESGMRYGDWEGEDEPVVYQEADVEVLPDSRNQYLALRSSSVSAAPAAPAASSASSASSAPLSLTQEARRFQRMTQPLQPRSAPVPGRGRFSAQPTVPQPTTVEAARVPRPTRQLTPHEPATPLQASAVPVRNTGSVRGVCPLCKGIGFLRANVPFGDPNFGKPLPCECKEAEQREKRRQQLLEISDISAFRSRNFNNFNTHFQGIHPSVQEAYQAAYAFAQSPDGWLVLVGPNGCGKTHLAAAIANQCLAQGEVVLFSVVPELLDHLRAAFAPSSTDIYDQLFSKMREAALLILDDLGAHYTTPWATEKLFQLLNYRYNWRMPTVITCNMSGLQTIDVRLRSRIADSSLALMVNMERARDCRPYLVRQEP